MFLIMLIKKKKKKKIKIGFISEFLTNHTIGKLFGGLIKNIEMRILLAK